MISKKQDQQLLSSISQPSDFRHFTIPQLEQLAGELREETIKNVSEIGGHLGAGLGVVELTVALHYVFNTPDDILVWDVGHQTQPHKILTERKDRMHTLRQKNGISGFPKPSESKYDTFGVGHSSTSISAALGMAVAREMHGIKHDVIAVIGDGALSAGMAYEAMNNAAQIKSKMIVILNDNEMSISPAVGAMSGYLCRLISSTPYQYIRNMAKNVLHHMPTSIESLATKTRRYLKDCATGGNFFEEMGFHYIGQINGHDLHQLVPILQNIQQAEGITRPILIHVKTQKGKGFNSPEESIEKFHAVAKFDPKTRLQKKPSDNLTYSKVFGCTLLELARKDNSIVGITAAMSSSTGIGIMTKEFPERTYDVGIAEQHAVTFAAGLAKSGVKPFVAIYSTFMQRAYDQVVHDVAIQNLPVRFIIDRAGFVGSDGETHCGSFDLSTLINLPNIVLMAPSDEQELTNMIYTAYGINDGPSAIRFPRAEISHNKLPQGEPIAIGKSRVIKHGSRIVLLSLGTRLQDAMKAAAKLEKKLGHPITLLDGRFAKPLDGELIINMAKSHEIMVTVEDGSAGGFGSAVSELLSKHGVFDQGFKFRALHMPDYFIPHATQQEQYREAEIDDKAIYQTVISIL
jgi:1-deoxy-D-xylulose-5-phosphate synthase